ncbi:DNA-binding transcriptional LysR family regulator [Cytobacillus oceanisediminis]|uniref:DNA-binding transcriptional LysR family regulator n=1 Tax=Cytobacillus oceanisediminis TaxID=665099 RepID=A0A2V2ZJW3_9BACI|nr:selenium metabolism-associated LysR family transcriptional regulator [Cytobacillus oceanisediminis]PWW20235.1 DNA-binding transcriptional LysR family regulator [Cytobacillus oceanisediminis]
MYPKYSMNFRKLEAFVLLIEKKSFSEVAAQLGCTQPAISQLIKSLEADLNLSLYDRYSSIIRTTPAGHFVYQKAKSILKQWEELEGEIQSFHNTLTGNLVIGASTIPGTYLIPQYVREFHRLFPNVSVSVEISDSKKIIDKIINNQVDIGLVGINPSSNKIMTLEVASDTLVFITPNNHPLSNSNSLNSDTLRNYNFVLREEGSGTRKVMEDYLTIYGIQMSDLQSVVHVGSTEALIASVEAGVGISCVSKLAAIPAATSGRIQIAEGLEPFKRSFYLSTLSKNTNLPIIKEFTAIYTAKDIQDEIGI